VVPLMAAGEAEKKEEGITHHGCGAAGAPSGLRSHLLLPGPLSMPKMPAVLGATKKCAYPY
jgi:hypothetical protein